MTKRTTHAPLDAAVSSRTLVRIVRNNHFEAKGNHLIGVPLQLGSAWVVIARMDDRINFDGFDALRPKDIDKVERQFPNRAFYISALRLKGARLPSLPRLRLDSSKQLLQSVEQWFPLLVIDREEDNPGAAEIGCIIRFTASTYRMKAINPSATWTKGNGSHNLAEITRVGFGGEYEESLAAVAGVSDPRWR